MWYFSIINKVSGEIKNIPCKFKTVEEAKKFAIRCDKERKDWKLYCKTKY